MKVIKNIIKFILITTVIIETINIIIDKFFKKEYPSEENIYDWENGTINYSKKGTGSPVLLIHDLKTDCCLDDLADLSTELSANHTVYSLDLIGCGKSAKAAVVYTNYLFVKLVNDFIKEVIGEKTDVVVFGKSSSFVIMSADMNKELYNTIVFVEPNYNVGFGPKSISRELDFRRKFLTLPIYGTFAYNVFCFVKRKPFIKNGKYLLSSKMAKFVNNYSSKSIGELTVNSKIINDYESTYNLADCIEDAIK